MRSALRWLLAAVVVALAGLPVGAEAEPKATYNNNFPSPGVQPYSGWNGQARPAPPTAYRQPRYYQQRPVVACDAYGRCWQQIPSSPAPGYYRQRGYGYDRPYQQYQSYQEPSRFVRRQGDVLCDRATSICYKNNRIDKTETRDAFGDRAADRADDVRDRFDTARVFVPERGFACDRQQQACYYGDRPDYRYTRHYFGQRAAEALD